MPSKAFEYFKQYIVHHPKVVAYKPTASKYDAEKLAEIVKKIPIEIIESPEDDSKLILDFIELSDYLHQLYVDLYKLLDSRFAKCNAKGIQIAQFIIAAYNREYKVISDKHRDNLKEQREGNYPFSDLLNFKINTKSGYNLDSRAALESYGDAINVMLSYLRFFLNKDFSDSTFDHGRFAGNLLEAIIGSTTAVVFKHSYDDMLYNGGIPIIDKEGKKIIFDYANHDNLKSLLAGNLIFNERKMHIWSSSFNQKCRLETYCNNYRIKSVKVDNGIITLKFGQGFAKAFTYQLREMNAAIKSYYEFLDGSMKLPLLADVMIDEAVVIWTALINIANHLICEYDFDTSLFVKDDFKVIPSKILQTDLYDYVCKLTVIKRNKVRAVINSFVASWESFNEFWSTPIYSSGDYFLLPLYAIENAVPYNIIDKLLERGGINLDSRGVSFEKFLYSSIKNIRTEYQLNCIPAGKYGRNGDEEEIDLIVALKYVVIVADAKCVHYSIEPVNYSDAWERLKECCEQACRKAEFVKSHPQLFPSLNDVDKKSFIPLVITNYPTYAGFCHKGVYVIDSHAFLSYLSSGVITMREIRLGNDPIRGIKFFYQNEKEYFENFLGYVSKHATKEVLKKHMKIVEHPSMIGIDPWTCITMSAQYQNDPTFNIHN